MDPVNDAGRTSPCSSQNSSEASDNLPIVIKRKTSRSLSSTISSSELLLNTSPIAPVPGSSNIYNASIVRSTERSNLLNLSILIVKHILDSAVKNNRVLDANEVPLVNLFTVLEGILLHGLRNRKTILGVEFPGKDIFLVLEIISQLQPEASLMAGSVKELPHVKTSLGKARAWLRLAFISKKLAEYFAILAENKATLTEYYSDGAFLLSEEASILAGHMTGLVIIDCNNWCARDEDLDKLPSIVDLKPYLRTSLSLNDSFDSSSLNGQEVLPDNSEMKSLLDQKNYLETVNQRLMDKIKKLETSAGKTTPSTTDPTIEEPTATSNGVVDPIKSLANELDSVVHVKNEMETALKLLEKDVHEKQDTIITLRKQLEDLKQLNIQMYHKMKQHETDLKEKDVKLKNSEQRLNSSLKTVNQLELKVRGMEEKKSALEQANQQNEQQIEEKNKKTTSMEFELRTERDKRNQLKKLFDDQQTQITKLTGQLEEMQQNLSDYNRLKKEFGLLQKKCSEYELSLEEMGAQLRE